MLHLTILISLVLWHSCGLFPVLADEHGSNLRAHAIEQAKLATVGILQAGTMQTEELGYAKLVTKRYNQAMG